MATHIDISSDIDEAISDVGGFFRGQMKFVMMNAINNTARDVQRHLRGVTLPAAIPRNKSLPRAMTYFVPDEGSGQGGLFRTQNFLKSKDTIAIGPVRDGRTGYEAASGFSERQVTGDTKRPKGTSVAIPKIGPGLKRLASGSIPSGKKPKNIRGNPKYFVHPKNGNIYERMGRKGDKVKLRFVLAKQARGTTALGRFYPDSFFVVERVFPGHFLTAMNRAIRSSRFTEV